MSLSLGILTLLTPAKAQIQFGSPQTLTVSAGARYVAVGDLDRDGDLDVVTVSNVDSDGFVTVLRNTGNGTFITTPSILVARGANSLTVGDVDGDSDLDIVTTNGATFNTTFNNNTLAVLRNNGNATFASPQILTVGNNPRSVALGDLDGDGDLDLAVANAGTTTIASAVVSVLKNQGNGSFALAQNFQAGVGPNAIAVGDLDNDGDLDLAISNGGIQFTAFSNTVSILKNNGKGSFAAPQNFRVERYPLSVTLGDLDNDGDLDLVGGSSSYLSILVNRDGGDFTTLQRLSGGGASVALGDLDNDGDLDIINNRAVWLNNGNGTFALPQTFSGGLEVVAIGDLDSDGKLDLATASRSLSTNNAAVLRNTTALGIPIPGITRFSPIRGRAGSIVTLRTNFSGISQVQFGGVPARFVDNGAGQATVTVPGGAPSDSIAATTLKNLVAFSASNFTVLPTPAPSLVSFTPTSGPAGTVVLITGENFNFNTTGVQFDALPAAFNLISPTQIFATVPFGATTSRVAVTTFGGTAISADTFTVTLPTRFGSEESWTTTPFSGSLSTLFGDVDGDGKADAVAVTGVSGGVTVRRSNGLLFGPLDEVWCSSFFGGIGTFLADVTGDGLADIVAINANGTFVRRSTGSSFGTITTIGENWSVPFYNTDAGVGRGTFLADVSGDGKADVVVVSNSGLFVQRSTGNSFGPTENWGSAFYGDVGTYLADIDGNGFVDIIAVNATSTTIRRSAGNRFSGGEFWSLPFYNTDLGVGQGTFFTDVTGDNKADAVVVNNTGIFVQPSTGFAFGETQFWGLASYGTRGTFFADVTGGRSSSQIVVNSDAITVRRSQ